MNASAARLLAGYRNTVSSPGAQMALNVVLVVAIAWTAATLTWRLLPGPVSVPDRSIPAAGPGAAGEPEHTDVAALHLFGQAPAGDSTASRPVPTEAPETRLNLKLTGVFAAGGGDGIAIIVAGNAEQAVYGVGDRVAGAARIDGIYADRVLLERNGALETLRLAEDGVATERAATSAARGSGDRDIQQIAQRARELRQRLTENPLELARMVRFQPYMRDGELVGYRIQPRTTDAKLLTELGLRPTDVVTQVNGVALNDPVQAQQALQRVQTAQTISVTWLREGEQHRMTIPVGPVR